MPGDIERRVPAEIVFHQGQREVDPAVTPAEVATFPSLMKIGSGLTRIAGYFAASALQ